MKRLVGPPSLSSSSDKRNAFARRKLQRTVDPLPAVNARSPRRTEKIRTKTKTARTRGTANGTEIVTAVVTTATRTGKETGIATVTVNGIGTETTTVEGGSITDETTTTTVIGPRGTTGTGITVIGHRSITRITTGTRGGGIASIGMTTVGRRVGVRESAPPRRSAMRGVRR